MNRALLLRSFVLALLLVTAQLFGCTKSSSGPALPAASSTPQLPQVRIELSEPRATVVNTIIGEGRTFVVLEWKVKYRFVLGQPQAGMFYSCQGKYKGASMGLLESKAGSELKQEGTFGGTATFSPNPPTAVEFAVHLGRVKNQLSETVSNSVTCQVQ